MSDSNRRIREARATGTVIGFALLALCIAQCARLGLRIASGRGSFSLGDLVRNDEFNRQRFSLAAMVTLYVVTIYWTMATLPLLAELGLYFRSVEMVVVIVFGLTLIAAIAAIKPAFSAQSNSFIRFVLQGAKCTREKRNQTICCFHSLGTCPRRPSTMLASRADTGKLSRDRLPAPYPRALAVAVSWRPCRDYPDALTVPGDGYRMVSGAS